MLTMKVMYLLSGSSVHDADFETSMETGRFPFAGAALLAARRDHRADPWQRAIQHRRLPPNFEACAKEWAEGFTKETGIKVTLRNGGDSGITGARRRGLRHRPTCS